MLKTMISRCKWFLLVLVVGIFSHDVSDGLVRICFYRSVYGMFAITIPVTAMCDLTQEFDI